jgi:F-type H+-transporting ATPase subunit alpha
VNVGISVSRVGGNAQRKAMKKFAGSLRLDLASFRALEAFSQLGTDLDTATQKQLDRGKRMVELLKQPQFRPLPTFEQVISIFAGTQGVLDEIPVPGVLAFEAAMLSHVRHEFPEILQEMEKTGDLPEALAKNLLGVLNNFKAQYLAANAATAAKRPA